MFGKGESFAYKLSQSLAQRMVESFDMGRLAPSFAGHMLRVRNDGLLRFPEIGVAGGGAPGRGHWFPQVTATLLTTIAQAASDDPARVAVQSHPDPSRFRFRAYKQPQLVPFQHRGGTALRG